MANNSPKTVRLNKDLNLVESDRWKFKYDPTSKTSDAWTGCNLKCMQCTHIKNNGHRCANRTCYTLPYCWYHLKSVLKLRIGPTVMKDKKTNRRYDFLGLFACDMKAKPGKTPKIVFKRGQPIAPYIGEQLTEQELNQRYPDNETSIYGYRKQENLYIDSACVRSVASFANACLMSSNENCQVNARLSPGSPDNYPMLVATKNIRHGSEIFVSYGASYFSKKSIHRPFKTTPAGRFRRLNYKC
jgi:hypothetical protein